MCFELSNLFKLLTVALFFGLSVAHAKQAPSIQCSAQVPGAQMIQLKYDAAYARQPKCYSLDERDCAVDANLYPISATIDNLLIRVLLARATNVLDIEATMKDATGVLKNGARSINYYDLILSGVQIPAQGFKTQFFSATLNQIVHVTCDQGPARSI